MSCVFSYPKQSLRGFYDKSIQTVGLSPAASSDRSHLGCCLRGPECGRQQRGSLYVFGQPLIYCGLCSVARDRFPKPPIRRCGKYTCLPPYALAGRYSVRYGVDDRQRVSADRYGRPQYHRGQSRLYHRFVHRDRSPGRTLFEKEGSRQQIGRASCRERV